MTINKKNEIDEDYLSELSIETSSFFSLSLSLSLYLLGHNRKYELLRVGCNKNI
jgi:hypothetical protein